MVKGVQVLFVESQLVDEHAALVRQQRLCLDGIVIAKNDLQVLFPKIFGGVLGPASDGTGIPIGCGTAFDDNSVIAHPLQRLMVLREVGAMSNAANSESFSGFPRGRAWGCFSSMTSQPKTCRASNRERFFVLSQIVEEGLITGQIESNDSLAGISRCRACDIDIRFRVVVSECCNHHACMDVGTIQSLADPITNSGHHRVHIESQMHVSSRAEAELQIIGSIRGGIFYGFAGNSSDVRGRPEEWIGGRNLGQIHREI